MTKLFPWACFVALLTMIVIGCGGGGGGGGCTVNCGGTDYSPIRAVVVNASGKFVDPSNLLPNSTYQLKIIGFDSSSGIHVLSGSSWSTTAPDSVATVSGGTLTTLGVGTGTYTLTGKYSGATYPLTIGIWSNRATLTGNVRTAGGSAVGGVVVEFYNSGGQLVGSTRSNPDGTFYSNVPTTATSFSANLIDLTGFYDVFSYNGGDFSHGVAGCRAKLPALTAGGASALSGDVVLQKKSNGPPPPPPGCFTS